MRLEKKNELEVLINETLNKKSKYASALHFNLK